MKKADQIRVMDDCELGNFICDTAESCDMCRFRSRRGCTVMEFLEEEVEDDKTDRCRRT